MEMGSVDVGWEQLNGVGPNPTAFITNGWDIWDAPNSMAGAPCSAGWQQHRPCCSTGFPLVYNTNCSVKVLLCLFPNQNVWFRVGLKKWHPALLENLRILRQSVDLEDKSHFSSMLLWVQLVLRRILVQELHFPAEPVTVWALPAEGEHHFSTRPAQVLGCSSFRAGMRFPVIPGNSSHSSSAGCEGCAGMFCISHSLAFPILTHLQQHGELRAPGSAQEILAL